MFCETAGEAVHKNRRLKVSLSSFLYMILAFGLYYAVVDTGKLSGFIFGLLFFFFMWYRDLRVVTLSIRRQRQMCIRDGQYVLSTYWLK